MMLMWSPPPLEYPSESIDTRIAERICSNKPKIIIKRYYTGYHEYAKESGLPFFCLVAIQFRVRFIS